MAETPAQVIARIKAKLNKLPPALEDALRAELKSRVDSLVINIKANAPFDPGNAEHQHLRDSVHAYPNPDRLISYFILADAKDADGKFIGSNIEAGHRNPLGEHVAARPFFFPTYRAYKKSIRAGLSKAGKKVIREFWGA